MAHLGTRRVRRNRDHRRIAMANLRRTPQPDSEFTIEELTLFGGETENQRYSFVTAHWGSARGTRAARSVERTTLQMWPRGDADRNTSADVREENMDGV